MTNHEKLAKITGVDEPVDIESVKMLLCRIIEDVENGLFESNFDMYLTLYKSQVEWLNAEVE